MDNKKHIICCVTCGNVFGTNHKRKYCTPMCRPRKHSQTWDERQAEYRKRNTYVCIGCGEQYVNKRKGKTHGRKYCSRECAFKNRPTQKGLNGLVCGPYSEVGFAFSDVEQVVCVCCGRDKRMRRKSSKVYRCEVCAAEYIKQYAIKWHNHKMTAMRPHKPKSCKVCGQLFSRITTQAAIYCSAKCAKRNEKLKHATSAKQRAKRAGVKYETISPLKVFERDGWRCQICLKQLSPNNRGSKKSNAPEIDHRVPLALGGDHTYKNVQCACRSCNNIKGARSRVGQIPLFNDVQG